METPLRRDFVAFQDFYDLPSDAEELAELKDERARYTVRAAYDTTPFWRDYLDDHDIDPRDIQGVEDLAAIPPIDGETIRQNQPPETEDYRMHAEDASVVRPFYTSGSTGTPKVIQKSPDEVNAVTRNLARGFSYFGFDEDTTVVNAFPVAGMNMSGWGVERGLEAVGAQTVPVHTTDYPDDVFAELLQKNRPEHGEYAFIALPSHADGRGHAMRDAGYDPADIGFDALALAGEPISAARKESLSDLYGDADIHDFYAATEGGMIGMQEDADDGFRIFDDYFHLDIVDENGDAVDQGEEGRVVMTNLLEPGAEPGEGESSAMPFIRYQPGDIGYLQEDPYFDGTVASNTVLQEPRRDKNEFILGAVNLDVEGLEHMLYSNDIIGADLEDYRFVVDYDKDSGRDVLTMELDVMTRSITGGQRAEDVRRGVDSIDIPYKVGQAILEENSHLNDTIGTGAQLNVAFVDRIDHDPGKPERLIDRRE